MSETNNSTPVKVKVGVMIADEDAEQFRKKLEKFIEGKTILEKHHSVFGVLIGAAKIPGMDTSMMQAQVKLMCGCYIVYECTEAEKLALKLSPNGLQ